MPAVPLSRSLVAAALLAAATAGLVAAELARACVCGGVDARTALERGAVALVGRVVSKSPVQRTPGLGLAGHRYVVRVMSAEGARIGGEVAVVGETWSPCGFEWRVGDRVGAFLGRIRGVWTTGGCGLVSPVELGLAMRPYPRPRGRGRVALVAGGGFGDARLMAFDNGGRILGYGFGAGTVRRISVCPGSRVAAELVDLDGRRNVVAVRSLRSLRVRSTVRVPHSIRELMCSDASGAVVYATATDYGRRQLHGRVRVFRIGGGRGTTVVDRPGQRAVLGPGTAYVWAGRDLIAISLPHGSARTVRPMGPPRLAAASPDGRRLAVHGFDDRLGLIDVATGEMSSRLTRSARVLRWLGSDRLLVRPAGGTQVYDTALRLERRYPRFDAFGQAGVGDRLFGTNGYRLIGLELAAGHQRTVALLPDRRIADLTGVPGRPLLQAPRTRPARRTTPVPAQRRPAAQLGVGHVRAALDFPARDQVDHHGHGGSVTMRSRWPAVRIDSRFCASEILCWRCSAGPRRSPSSRSRRPASISAGGRSSDPRGARGFHRAVDPDHTPLDLLLAKAATIAACVLPVT